MNTVRSPRIDDRHHRFKALACLLEHMAAKEAIVITPFASFDLHYFSGLSEAQQDHVLWQLETIVQVSQRLQGQGEKISNSQKLVWGFFKHTRLRPPSGVLERIGDENSVEIYNHHHQLIFANLYFFQILSYSLEDLYCRAWIELFGRDRDGVHGQLCEATLKVMSGEVNSAVDLSYIPEHTAYETQSPGMRSARCHPRFLSPIFESHRLAGYLAINHLTHLDVPPYAQANL